MNINLEREMSRDLTEAEWTPLFQGSVYSDVIMHALISCIDRFTVTTGAELKRLINMTGFQNMPICNDAGQAECVEV